MLVLCLKILLDVGAELVHTLEITTFFGKLGIFFRFDYLIDLLDQSFKDSWLTGK